MAVTLRRGKVNASVVPLLHGLCGMHAACGAVFVCHGADEADAQRSGLALLRAARCLHKFVQSPQQYQATLGEGNAAGCRELYLVLVALEQLDRSGKSPSPSRGAMGTSLLCKDRKQIRWIARRCIQPGSTGARQLWGSSVARSRSRSVGSRSNTSLR